MAGLSSCVLLVGFAAGGAVLSRDERHDVRPGTVEAPRASPAAAAAALADVAAALRGRDTDALVALAPPDDESARTVLGGVGRNVRSLAVRDVALRYVDQAGATAPDGSWTAVAEVDWRLGPDDATSTAEVLVGLAPDGARLAVTGFVAPASDARARLPLWLRGRLSVARSPGVLVLADGPQRVADTVARRATVGTGVVQRVLPGWSGPVVVEVPGTAADLDETLGAVPGSYAGIAAVTTAAGSGTDVDAPVHVFVNPEVTSGLRRAGAQVVMSHELVHVATDATRTPMETWLLEGFADYVALRDVDLPDTTTLGRAIRAARMDGVPDRLPAAADFDTRASDLQARYEQAWLACRVVADVLGEEGLVHLYDDAAGGEPVDRALARAGLPIGQLTRRWRSELATLAG